MKTTRLFFAPVLALGLLLSSCAKEEIISTNSTPVKHMQAAAYESCESQCIVAGSGDYFVKSGSLSGKIGSNTKGITYSAYNTETDFVVVVSYNRTPVTSKSSSTITVTVNGVSQSNTIVNHKSATYTFPLASGWNGCDETSVSIAETVFDGAAAMSGNTTYNLIGICNSCSLEGDNFSGNVTSCTGTREAVYTLSSEDGMSSFTIDGDIHGSTGTPVVSISGGDNISHTIARKGSSNNYDITVNGTLGACSTVTVTVNWTWDTKAAAITGTWTAGAMEVEPLKCK